MSIPERTLDSVDAVIGALGGTSAVARLVGRSPQAVSNARSKGELPADWYFVMSEALKGLGLPALPTLWGMVAAEAGAEARTQ